MKLNLLKMLVQDCTEYYAYTFQVVQFWNSTFKWYSFIWNRSLSWTESLLNFKLLFTVKTDS